MILDRLSNAYRYGEIHPRIRRALDYLAATDFASLPDGRRDLEGDTLFALIQRYKTKPAAQGKWEAHRKYIDVQYIAQGAEIMGRAHREQLTPTQSYSDEKDVVLLEGDGDFFTLNAGDFALLYPEDAHMPCLACGEVPVSVIKVVVKILVEKTGHTQAGANT